MIQALGIKTVEEFSFGPFWGDVYIESANTIIEFNGCYYHGHKCKDGMKSKRFDEARTRERRRGLVAKEYGHNLLRIWGCHFENHVEKISTEKWEAFVPHSLMEIADGLGLI